ncbi:probable serine/threonine-protein kinase At1g54610 [Lotus japonicus]|uniref:probable serine/threonine-protein kinase At1g54610 n=1 Tax=Lotus japonicus TaxID=34305 RepID=UPI002582DA35|nr:probable serine/threonine-protein kinase At1g54610 [Lotus japonicus]XP_057439441.1 probable serine/threonine-protein kinase At1g54610 [Lotus japonicus]
MGCVIGREASSGVINEEKSSRGGGNRKLDGAASGSRGEAVVEAQNGGKEEKGGGGDGVQERQRGERRRSKGKANPRLSNPPRHLRGEQVAAGWPPWLTAVCGEALNGWIPRKADTFEKIDKIGQGTYSNVYKAKDTLTGKIVALKKVRFDNLEPESVKFMAREIIILRRLDHPNVVKLQGLVTSRMSCSLYLVFDYMVHDLAGLAASPGIRFTEPQVKCYMRQLLSGLEHCHHRRVLHRDIKGSNLLIDNEGVLKIADFGLASVFDPNHKHPMTSRVVTLWYRPPELLLGATDYDVGVDLWSAGCILGELLAGKPIMPGRTEVEQLHKIYKLCGSPSDEYWKKSKLPNATLFKPREPYKRCIREIFKDFPPSALPLIDTLLAIDPVERRTASDALRSEFFTTEPYACDPSSLPKYPPSKEMDAKRRDDEMRRQRAAGKAQADGSKKHHRTRDRAVKAFAAPEANAELQSNIDRRRLITHANAKSKSEKFPPPHQDGQLGFPLGASHHIDPDTVPTDVSFTSVSYNFPKEPFQAWSGPIGNAADIGVPKRKKKHTTGDALDLSKPQKGALKDKVKGKKIIA